MKKASCTLTIPPLISQETLKLAARAMRSMLVAQRMSAIAAREYQQRAQSIIANLQRGGAVESGRYSAALRKNTRRCVRWKQVVIDKCGKDEALRILNTTPPTIEWRLVVYAAVRREGFMRHSA